MKQLSKWNLTSLKEKRKRVDHIQMYKVTKDLEVIDWYTGPRYAPETQTSVEEYLSIRKGNFPSLNSR